MNGDLSRLWLSRRLGGTGTGYSRRIRGKGSILALVMILLVIAQIFVSSMIDGIIDKFAYLSNGHLQLFLSAYPSDDLIRTLSDLPEIAETNVIVQGNALAYSTEQTAMIRLKGVAPDYFSATRRDQLNITGTNSVLSSRQGILISATIAEELGVTAGDSIALMVVPDIASTKIRPLLMTIDGVYDSGYRELDSQLCFISDIFADQLFGSPASRYIEILVDKSHTQRLDQVMAAIENALDTPHVLQTWYQAQPTLYDNLQVSQQLIFGVFIVVALLAGFFVISVAQEFMQDDKQSIAILKLLGTNDRDVVWIYCKMVFRLVIVSLGIGLVVGLILGTNMGPILSLISKRNLPVLSWYLLDFDVTIPWSELLTLVATLLVASTLSMYCTLRRTRKISPMELFR